jgi:tetratricopeptide (TPR) repeat protein
MLEEWERAMGFFREAVRRDRGGRCYGAWFGLGNVYLKTGKYTLAEYHFRRALEINQGNVTLVCCVGTVRSLLVLFLWFSLLTYLSLRRSSRNCASLEKRSRCTNERSLSLRKAPSLGSSVFASFSPSSNFKCVLFPSLHFSF